MRQFKPWTWTAVLLLVAGLGSPARAAEKLSKEDEQWLDTVAPLILPSERETFENLRKEDRAEFKKIFWARRDTNPEKASAENEYKAQYMESLQRADRDYRVLGRKGSQTDCGMVFLLLGEPAEVVKEQRGMEPGTRDPETWIYRGANFTGGETSIYFDQRCDLPRGSGLKEQLVKVAESKVTRPGLTYKIESGKLVSLDDMLPKPSPAAELMQNPRQDFAMEAETKLMMRGQDGATYVAGLVRGDASGMKVRDQAGRRTVDLMLGIEAVAMDGSVPQSGALQVQAEVDDQGRFLASWPLTVQPGNYTVRIGAVDPESKQGSVTNLIFDAQGFSSGELSVSDLLIFGEMRQGVTSKPDDTLGAFTLGTNQIRPSFGNVFRPQDEIQVIGFIYDAPTDEAGTANVAVTFEILKAGKPISRSQQQVLDTKQSVAAIGPVPLASFQPGEYAVKLKVVERNSGAEQEKTRSFSVEGGEAAAEAPPAAPSQP